MLRLGGHLQHGAAGDRRAAGPAQGREHPAHRRGRGRGGQHRLPGADRHPSEGRRPPAADLSHDAGSRHGVRRCAHDIHGSLGCAARTRITPAADLSCAAPSQLPAVVLRPGGVAHRHLDADDGAAGADLSSDRLGRGAGGDQRHRLDPADPVGALGRLDRRSRAEAHHHPDRPDGHDDPGVRPGRVGLDRRGSGLAGLCPGVRAGRGPGRGSARPAGVYRRIGRGQGGSDQRHRVELGDVQRRTGAGSGAGWDARGHGGRRAGLPPECAELRGRDHQPAADAQSAGAEQACAAAPVSPATWPKGSGSSFTSGRSWC